MSDRDTHLHTRLVHSGRSASRFGGTVNPPIQRASTILAESASDLYGLPKSLYGRMGMAAHDTLCEALCELEGASHAQLASNGLNACAMSLASVLDAGDHLIASDSIYGPTRRFCERFLSRMGVETSFVHPRSTDQIAEAIRENTRAIFLESPGSLTFEFTDIDPVVELARSRNITTILDNTWGAGIFCKPLDFGIDISVQALTKYVIGHSDGFGGAVMTRSRKLTAQIEATAQDWGVSMSPDDAYLAQRGIRSLALRMKTQGEAALLIARHLNAHPAIEAVLHPALETSPDHQTWKKYFSGSSGLFGFCLKPGSTETLNRFFDKLTLFGFGFSWGGFESLMIPCDPQLKRCCSPEWDQYNHGPLIRVSIGLEDPADLIADLDQALLELTV